MDQKQSYFLPYNKRSKALQPERGSKSLGGNGCKVQDLPRFSSSATCMSWLENSCPCKWLCSPLICDLSSSHKDVTLWLICKSDSLVLSLNTHKVWPVAEHAHRHMAVAIALNFTIACLLGVQDGSGDLPMNVSPQKLYPELKWDTEPSVTKLNCRIIWNIMIRIISQINTLHCSYEIGKTHTG